MRTRRAAKLEAGETCSGDETGAHESEEAEEGEVLNGSGLPDVIELQSTTTTTSEPGRVITLASALDPGPGPELYFSCDTDTMIDALMVPRGGRGHLSGGDGGIMKRSVLTSDFEKKESVPPSYQSRYTKKKENKALRDQTSGEMWFNMSAPQLTPQLKNDLQVLRMRGTLDPSRHYKANDSKKLPKYFQVGRILSSSADFYSSRIPRRQQKQSLVDELLSDDDFRSYHKKKYLELQKKCMSGSTRHKNIPFKKKFKTKSMKS